MDIDKVRENAIKFVNDHKNDRDERQQAQAWIKELLESVFGINNRKVNAGFEWRVKSGKTQKYVDHLLNGVLLTEMKSRGKPLDKAKSQAYNYVMKLDDEDIPQVVLLSDFKYIYLYNLDNNSEYKFLVEELPKNVELFSFLYDKKIIVTTPKSPVNKEAAQRLEKFHHRLKELNYPSESSSLLMTRLVFCFFADDTGIFEKNQFYNFILNYTDKDGSDLLHKLTNLFVVLNTPDDERFQDDIYTSFRYINGGLFDVSIPSGLKLTSNIRDMLLELASELDWSQISPIIFGSMFEGALDENRRHDLGAHYTSEKNIMKALDSLFLNDLTNELDQIKNRKKGRKNKYKEFHDKLSKLTFLDPACGSGNFLILAYRELRRLENEVINLIMFEEYLEDNRKVMESDSSKFQYQSTFLSIEEEIKVNINQFYGIEIEGYAVSIAKLGLWLMDHLMNIETSNYFGQYFVRFPLKVEASIVHGNAMEIKWFKVIDPRDLDYIIGNPPFIGARKMSTHQSKEIKLVSQSSKSGQLDYVAGWYYKSVKMMDSNPNIEAALVSTNSISQGIQATILGKDFFEKDVVINFAHETFKWDNDAKIFVVIVGFSKNDRKDKEIYKYKTVVSEPIKKEVKIINEYLIDEKPVLINKSKKQISGMPLMFQGTQPIPTAPYVIKAKEIDEVLEHSPELKPYLHKYIGSYEFINDIDRYILNLKGAPINIIRKNSFINERLLEIVDYRENKSPNKAAEKMAKLPTHFVNDRTVKGKYIIVPAQSSSNREYMPVGMLEYPDIASNTLYIINSKSYYLLGVLQSKMHMVWMKFIGGKLKGDYRYSNELVYNNFVFPRANEKQKEEIAKLMMDILDLRDKYSKRGDNLADLYKTMYMPADLLIAHENLDESVESLYKKDKFMNDNERMKKLISLYQKNK